MKTSETKKTKPAKKNTTKKVAKVTAVTKKEKAVKEAESVVVRKNDSAKSCPNSCSSCQDEMTDAFIQEVTEDVHNDNLKAFWNKYGLYVVLFVVIAVSSAVGFETIKGWRQKQLQAKTEAYISAMVQNGNYDASVKALEKIAAGNYGIYSQQARINIADILFEQNKVSEATDMLQAIIDNEELSERTRSLAALKLATYKLDTAPSDKVKALLQPIVDANNAWSPLAQEMLAMLAVKDGDFEKARSIYSGLLQNENMSENFRGRIQDMLSALSDM